MSYCRWQNTANDLRDCAQSMDPDEGEERLSSDERAARSRTLRTCAEMLEAIGIDIDTHDLERRIAALDNDEEESPR